MRTLSSDAAEIVAWSFECLLDRFQMPEEEMWLGLPPGRARMTRIVVIDRLGEGMCVRFQSVLKDVLTFRVPERSDTTPREFPKFFFGASSSVSEHFSLFRSSVVQNWLYGRRFQFAGDYGISAPDGVWVLVLEN